MKVSRYVPNEKDEDETHQEMQQGQGVDGDLRDPYLLTDEGHDWLRAHDAEDEVNDHRQ